METRVERQLGLPDAESEGTLERLFNELASLPQTHYSGAGLIANDVGSLSKIPDCSDCG
jgi:hypothetical protein